MARLVNIRDVDANGRNVPSWVPESEVESGGGGSVSLETPTGAVNGVNDDFVFSSAPIAVFYQGILQDLTDDYTVTGSTVTFAVPPVSGTVKGLVSS